MKHEIEDIIKSNIIYVDSVTSTCLDNIKGINVNSNYIDNVKSTYIVIIKSTNVNNNYLDSIKSTFADRIKSNNIIINKVKNNITSVYCKNINIKNNKIAYSKIKHELNALLKIKKVTNINNNIIIEKKTSIQAINIKYELSRLRDASENVIILVNKHIMKIIKDNSDACNNINNTTHIVIYENI